MVHLLKKMKLYREGVKEYMTRISKHKPRSYQIDAVYDALKT